MRGFFLLATVACFAGAGWHAFDRDWPTAIALVSAGLIALLNAEIERRQAR